MTRAYALRRGDPTPRGIAEEDCPHEWGHGSLEGYATVLRRSASQESSRRAKKLMDSSITQISGKRSRSLCLMLLPDP
jgi:hypothetical protein